MDVTSLTNEALS